MPFSSDAKILLMGMQYDEIQFLYSAADPSEKE
jgi:hypothetical protein